MSLWVGITIFAAFMQNIRFMLQKHLRTASLSTGGATFSRFLFSSPLVAIGIVIYLQITGAPWPEMTLKFWLFVMAGGAGQILATACVVALFTQRNFAVGIVFKKTEVVQTALIGLVVLGEGISAWGIVAILIGFVGVVLLSDPPNGGARFFNKAAGYGLASGALFGIASIGYRGAALELNSADVFLKAGVALACATAFQTLTMILYLALKEPGEITRVAASWRVSSIVGITSMLGSFGWFTAFALQNAAYVKALGQVELVFTFLASYFIFKERSTRRELAGIAFVIISIFCIIAAL
jgi:drug/metabolite transporter (DMT)-like permease